MMKLSVVLNAKSGSLAGSDLAELEHRLVTTLDGPRFSIVSVTLADRPLDDVLAAAVAEDSDGILVGGGDGSVSAAAAAAWRSGKILGVLPGGTMNLYARTLGMPLDLHESIDALARARVTPADIATANDAPFIHQFTVGLHAKAVRLRQKARYGSRYGKLLATARAFAAVIAHPPTFNVDVRGDRVAEARYRVSALSVSNNPFGEGHVPYADEPDGGVLGLYRADPLELRSAVSLLADIMLGSFATNDDVHIGASTEVRLTFPDRTRGARHALLDGELVALERTVDIVMHAGALRVLRPAGEAS